MARAIRHRPGTREVAGHAAPHGRAALTRDQRRARREAARRALLRGLQGRLVALDVPAVEPEPAKPKRKRRMKARPEPAYKVAQRERQEATLAARTVLLPDGQRVPYSEWAAGRVKGPSLRRRTWAWLKEAVKP